MRGLFLVVLTGFILSGCIIGLNDRKTRRKRRANRKIERAQELAPGLFSLDTVLIRDTVVIERFTHDTTTTVVFHDSTIIVNNERVFARYFYDTLRQEIHHEIECKEIIKPTETRVISPTVRSLTFWEQYGNFPVWVLIGVVVVLVFRFLLEYFHSGYK